MSNSPLRSAGQASVQPDLLEVRRANQVLHAPGQVVELRALSAVTSDWRSPHTVAGYFNDREQLVKSAAGINATGVYWTPNPVNPALLARCCNRAEGQSKGGLLTSGKDITCRRWLLIDLDPVRPAEISSTDEELNLAHARAADMIAALGSLGWPAPVYATSGNGAHLLYRIDLPADDGGLVKSTLAALAARFDDDGVKVDQKVFDPNRIWKAYGTVARKGDHTPERPHRVARLIDVPATVNVLTAAQLAAFAAPPEPARPAATGKNAAGRKRSPSAKAGPGGAFDLPGWLVRCGVPVGEPQPWAATGGTKWVLAECPQDASHRGSAFILQFPDGPIAGGCHHNSCTGLDWPAMRRIYEERAGLGKAARPGARDTAVSAPDEATDRHPGLDLLTHPQYVIDEENRTIFLKWERKEGDWRSQPRVVADFYLRIAAVEEGEDGQKRFVLEGETVTGAALRVELTGEEFASDHLLFLRLTTAAAPHCGVAPGMVGHLRFAIQRLSTEAVHTVRRFDRTGWLADTRADPPQPYARFLIPGRNVPGALTMLPRKLPYCLDGGGDPALALKALEGLLRCKDPMLTTAALAFVLEGPLARLAGWENERYGLFIFGPTGSHKTSFMQALLCLYGAGFIRDEALLKLGEGATRNALLAYCTHVHDLPMLIDNFKANTGDGDRGFINLLHNVLEGSDRDRMNRYAVLQESRPFNVWPVFTGEDLPQGDPATLARLMLLPFSTEDYGHGQPGGTNEMLALAQRLSPHLPALGAAWLDTLESERGRQAAEWAKGAFARAREEWAEALRAGAKVVNPLRVATNLATNELVFRVASELEPFNTLLPQFGAAHRAGLVRIGEAWATHGGETMQAHRFIEVLRQLLGMEKYVLAPRGKNAAFQNDRQLGWTEEDGSVYLLPDLARAAVESVLGRDALGKVTNETLGSQLNSLGHLASSGKGRFTRVVRLNEANQRVLHLTRAALFPEGVHGGED